MNRVLITGGSGLIGGHLSQQLLAKGYAVSVLGRKHGNQSAIKSYVWDYANQQIEIEAVTSADIIIHLCGANIAEQRWNVQRKKELIDSRVKTAELLYQTVKQHKVKLKAFVSASAIGYYGALTSDHIYAEDDPHGEDFSAEICHLWEQSVQQFENLGIRTVMLRTAPVLTAQGGALAKMLPPVKMGIASALGSGEQYFPWIHISDLCNIYLKAIEDENLSGAYNAVAPEHQTNKEFSRCLAKVLDKPFWFPNVPSTVMKIMFGEMSDVLLKGSRVSAEKIQTAGYTFQYPQLEQALSNLLR